MRTVIALTVLVLAPGAPAQTVYSQGPGDIVGFGFYSSSVSRPTRNYKHADDFTLAADAAVSTITWRGMSEGAQHPDLRNVNRFRIDIYSASAVVGGDVPGALLKTQTFSLAQTAPTLTGRTAFDTGAFEYSHAVTLSTPFNASGGVKYFLAISVTPFNTSNDAWMWQDGQFVNGASALLNLSSTQWAVFNDTDSCFSLAVPAPAAASMLGLGSILALRRRRGPELDRAGLSPV